VSVSPGEARAVPSVIITRRWGGWDFIRSVRGDPTDARFIAAFAL
jgi:hypothetical protein